jgi:hypothetical protein
MASLNSLQLRAATARGIVNQVVDDSPVAVRLKYVGSGTVTSVTVTTATDITFVTSDGGTDAYTWANYTTLGALVDKINSDGIFEARILDALRTTATGAGLVIDGAITISSEGYYDMKSDTSNADFLAARISYDRATGSSKLRAGHRVHLQSIVTNVTLGGGADANALAVYQYNPANQVETLIWKATPTTGSEATITWASGQGKITADEGCDLIVIVSDATSTTGTLTAIGIAE